MEKQTVWYVTETTWKHCSPRLLASDVDCTTTPRRPCKCAHGGSHDHLIVSEAENMYSLGGTQQ